MASDVRILTPSGWESIKGPKGDTGADGPAGPSAVSTDAGQLAKLGTDSKVLVAQADLDFRYVKRSGDSLYGNLTAPKLFAGGFAEPSHLTFRFEAVNGACFARFVDNYYCTASFGPRQADKTTCTIQYFPIDANPKVCWAYNYSETEAPILYSDETGNFTRKFTVGITASSFVTKLGVAWSNPTSTLEVGGDATIRGDASIVGNITSSGTAHNFAAGSITASAIDGLPAASAVAGAALAAAGAVGASTAYARADHTHPFPTAANVGALPLAGGALTGAVTLTRSGAGTYSLAMTNGAAYANFLGGTYYTAAFGPRPANDGYCTVTWGWDTPASSNNWQTDFGAASFSMGQRTGGALSNKLTLTAGGVLTPSAGIVTPALTLSTKRTPASQTAAGAVGQVEWDADYLYLAIAANQWRRVPWCDWMGNTLPGSGAGATDQALPATFDAAHWTQPNPVGAMVPTGYTITNAGKIVMILGGTVPALATGVVVQYRIHGGNWVNATVASYWAAGASGGNPATGTPTNHQAQASFQAMKAYTATTVERAIVISGPPANTPYITRMAWVSSIGTGWWSGEFSAVTPTA